MRPRDDLAALVAALRPQVDDPICRLDHDHGIALIAEAVQHVEQMLDIVEVQSGRRLVQDIERASGVALGKLTAELDPLGLAAGKRGGALAEPHIGQADIHQGLELAVDDRNRGEEGQRVLNG
ncbi:hypothetical protein Thivi_2478 [Thiocystis violascens DSM 198]|uniref:Uncharacterized protein n=1 Tax=Thiocystis violascens (strain ATCC 17096 / DSM 198 / 6111) TaxID=765911 RepID=I3YBQ0_THIV6|nr:hypothetical protein Thivi_2478 [Thiocystis violascens DSM 198]